MANSNILYDINKINSIEILGMTGITYSTGYSKYFIDSELLNGGEHDIAVFKSRIKYLQEDNNENLSETQKQEILNSVLKIFEANNLKVLLL